MSRQFLRRTLGPIAGLAVTATVAVVLSTPSATADSQDAARAGSQARLTPTGFALKGSGFGTRVVGGEIPAESDTTAFQALGCTNQAGHRKQNAEAEQTVPGLGLVSGVRTTLRTTRRNGVVATTSTQRIESIVLAESSVGSLTIEALRSRARAFHDRKGYHATATTDIGRLVLHPAAGDPQVLPLPSPDQPVVVPGLAEIEIGPRSTTRSRTGSAASATGLIVRVLPSGTRATVGQARARIGGGVESVLFGGQSYGIRARGLDDTLTKGKTPLSLMPCRGTLGKVTDKTLAGFDLTDQIEVGTLRSGQVSSQEGRQARGWERGSVASITLADGRLVITDVVGKANVRKDGGRATYGARGTKSGSVVLDGERQRFPDSGVLEIPGIARLESRVVTRKRNAVSVVALRITLLDGTGATIDLGNASIRTRPSGR